MDEVEKKKKQQDKAIADAAALEALEQVEGWQIVKSWIDEAIKTSQMNVFNDKKTKNWSDYLRYQAKYDAFQKLLFLIETRKKDGAKALGEQNG